MHELARWLEHEPGVWGACVEGLQVFADRETAETVEKQLEDQQEGWPRTTFELLQTDQQRHRLKVSSLSSANRILGSKDFVRKSAFSSRRLLWDVFLLSVLCFYSAWLLAFTRGSMPVKQKEKKRVAAKCKLVDRLTSMVAWLCWAKKKR